MSERLLKFTSTPRTLPDKASATTRIRNFQEIYAEFAVHKAKEQAARCSQCGIPFCQSGCPLQNNIPDWLMLTAEGRLQEAYQVSAETNTFPEICGRVCPQDRLCEGACVIDKGFEAVTIGAVEKYLTDNAWKNGWVKPPQPLQEHKASVGIIGAGPAGLAAAEMLRRRGIQVHIYDRYDRGGGLMMYGIPNFKLDKAVVQRRIDLLADAKVKYHFNKNVDRDVFNELRQRHQAVLIATGVYKARDVQILGRRSAGVVLAMDYLTASNRKGLGDTVKAFDEGELNAAGRDVVVIGGGDTAMDCVRTAVRQGAASVTCLYRRNKANMPGSKREVHHAEEEGVRFEYLAAPQAFLGQRRVEAVRASRMHLGQPDASGRQQPVVREDDTFTLPASMVILALGYDAEPLPTMFGVPELAVTQWGTLKVDSATGETSLPRVYAAGDIVRGASLVVWAIKDGRDVAEAMTKAVLA